MEFKNKINLFSYIDLGEISSPSNPDINVGRLYVADDSGVTKIYLKDSAGAVTELGGAGGGSFSDTFVVADWSDGGTYYYLDITHDLGVNDINVILWEDDGSNLEKVEAVVYQVSKSLDSLQIRVDKTPDNRFDGLVVVTYGMGSIPSGVQGNILYHNGSSWVVLAPGTSGHVLKTQGAAADPIWAAESGGSGSLPVGTQGDVLYYNGVDWVVLGAGTDGQFLKTQGAAANPTWDDVDAFPSGTQGDILYYNGSNWVVLGAGTSGHVLKTQGAGANPQWAAESGSSLPSGTQGDILYYDGADWVVLNAGTDGQFLKTQGAGANPTWDTAGGGSGTGFEAISEGGNDGFALVGDDRANKGDIGEHALDASYSPTASSTIGATGNESACFGRTNTSSGQYSMVCGIGNETSGNGSFANGTSNIASGNYSTSLGNNNNASGAESCCIGEDCVSSGKGSVCIGDNCDATATNSTAIGYTTVSEADYAIAAGERCRAEAKGSLAMGFRNEAEAIYSVALGSRSRARYPNFIALGGDAVNVGYEQHESGIVRGTSSGSTPINLYPANSATYNMEVLYDFSYAVICKINVKEGGTGNCAFYELRGMVHRDGASATLDISTTTTIFESAALSGCSVELKVSGTDMVIEATGIAATDLKWVGHLEIIENWHS
jgi:hypothetical protein